MVNVRVLGLSTPLACTNEMDTHVLMRYPYDVQECSNRGVEPWQTQERQGKR